MRWNFPTTVFESDRRLNGLTAMKNQMKTENQNKSIQTTIQKATPTPHEIKPKFEFGTIEIAAIFGIILTAIVGIIVRIWWAKRERIVKASDDLHAAFAPALAQIYLAKKP